MAITINSTPNAWSLSKDPLVFNVSSDQYVQTAGVKAKRTIVFDNEPGLTDLLRMNSNTIGADPYIEFEFVAAVTSANSGNAIRVRPSGYSTADWIDEHVVPNLRANSLIDLNYNVFRSGDEVCIEARETGPEQSFTTFSGVGFDADASVNTVGVDAVFTPDYSIRVKLFLEESFGSGTFIESSLFNFKPELDGSLSIDLSEKADELFDDLGIPSDVSMSGVELNVKGVRKFYAAFADHYGLEPFSLPSTVSDAINLMKGSIRKDHGYTSTTEFQDLVNQRKFLTNQTGLVQTKRSQYVGFVHFIQWYNTELLNEDVLVKAKVYYTDGSITTTALPAFTDLVIGGLYYLQCGFDALGLNLLEPLKTPYKYELWVESSSFALEIAAPKMFHLMPSVSYSWTVAFRNGFGLFETFLLDGSQDEKIAVNSDTIRVGLDGGGEHQDSDKVAFNIFSEGALELTSGILEENQMDGFIDLIMSPFHWVFPWFSLQDPIGVKLVPGEYQLAKKGVKGEHFESNKLLFMKNRIK